MISNDASDPIHRDTPVMFHSIDRNGRLVDVSNYWLKVLGYRRDEVIGCRSIDFFTEQSRRYAEEVVIPEFFRIGFCTDVPYQLVTKSGGILDVLLSATAEVDERGDIVRSLAVLTDVTQRKQTEKALKDAEEIFAKAFRASDTILLITTLDCGTVLEVNDSFARTLGYTREEVVGRRGALASLWETPKDSERYRQILKNQGKVRDLEVRLRSKSGGGVVGLVSGEIAVLDGEERLLSLIKDITGQKRAAEEIEVLHTDLAARALELEIANEELEAFSYTVSHDLRKPLTAINGYCQILLEMCGGELNPQCQGFLQEIVGGAVRMSALIDTILEFSRVSHSELYRTTVDLSALAEAAVEELKTAAPERRAQISFAQGLVDNGDANLLRVVLENLVGNAWKYTAQKDETVIEFGALEAEGKIAYFVRDNGVGFDGANAEKLFTAFHRQPGTQQFNGFGIGLATVERIVKRHGGRVWAEGDTGKGASFYFTLN